jgi:hypothetical protein
MAGFDDPAFFGDRWADVYDESTTLDPPAAVAFLAAPAGDGRVLELWIGTGRLGLPLRYCCPGKSDLMAEKAGFRLRERYADWDRRPFASDSASHVFVYPLG